jgi:hypothetical protein
LQQATYSPTCAGRRNKPEKCNFLDVLQARQTE